MTEEKPNTTGVAGADSLTLDCNSWILGIAQLANAYSLRCAKLDEIQQWSIDTLPAL